jgi:MFS transporter, DHA1 family, multidrug resistance protein
MKTERAVAERVGLRDRITQLEQWRKNQIAVTVSGGCIFFGYWLVMPFLPIYVRQLGVQSTAGVAFWSGLLLSSSPLMAALAGPIWGRLGDRIGLRLMAQRSTIANASLWFAMGFAQNVYQFLALRILLGLLGGFNSVSVALITQAAPRDKVARVIGTLQSVQILVAAIAPFAGGALAHTIGVRYTFFVTGIIMLGSVFSVLLLYRDNPAPPRKDAAWDTGEKVHFWKRPEFLTTMMVLFFINMADRTFGPILPLFLEELGTPESRLAFVSGSVISVAAAGEAFAAWLSGRLASRITLRKLITVRLALSILVLLPMVLVHSSLQFSALRVMLALLAGGTLTLALTAASHVIPPEHRGAGFGLLQSTTMFGNGAGPLIAGAIAGFSIRSVFVFNSIVYLLMVGFVYRNVRN